MKNLCSTFWRTGQVLFQCNPLTFLLQVLILQTGISLILSNVPWDTIQQTQWHCFLFFLPPGSRLEVSLLPVFWRGQKLAGSTWGVYGEERLLLYLPSNGGRERDCSVFVFNLATKAVLVSLPISWKLCLICSQSSPYWATVLFLLWGRTALGRSSWSTE